MTCQPVELVALLTGLVLAGCGGDSDAPRSMKPVPVTVQILAEQDFARDTYRTGSVSPYRQEKIGFEVGGRLLAVRDVGKEVEGPAFDEEQRLVSPGEVIATIDDARYRFRAQALEARLKSLRRQVEAERIDVEQVAVANLLAARARLRAADNDVDASQREIDEAQAALILARQGLDRQKRAAATGAVSQHNVDEAQSDFDRLAAQTGRAEAGLLASRHRREAQHAVVTTAEAAIALKRAELESTSARVDEVAADLERARRDVEDCALRAPFSGRITSLHASQGAVVAAGTPVITLSLMDPIQVRVAVSADLERRTRTGDRALIYPKDPIDPDGEPATVNALVYEKGAVADPLTRTFRIDLMVRNERRRIHEIEPETKGLPVVTDFLPVVRRYRGEEGDVFVPTDAVYREGGKTFVLRLPGVGFHSGAQRGASGKHMPEKVEVALGERYMTVIKWTFRSLAESGGLREGDFLAMEPRKEHLGGLAIGRAQWLLRPGDLVPVRFLLQSTPRGLYVPIDAITPVDGVQAVFVVEEGVARRRNVSVHEAFEERRRIEGEGLEPGVRVIVGGVHYVTDGQPVSIVEQPALSR